MSREIKFRYMWKRGASVVYRDYYMCEIESGCAIAPMTDGRYWECIARRQFTNQTDINNKDIYDQDIVKLTFENAAWDEPVVYHEVVRFHNGMWMAGDKPLYRDEYAPYTVEVVGNVFENEDLVSK